MNAKTKTFTMRLSEALEHAVELVRQRKKESSVSEVARQLLEIGIEADRRAEAFRRVLPDEPRAALRILRDRFYRNESLTREEWAFLANKVHDSYLHPGGRSFVSRPLLVDVLYATRALFIAREQHTGKSSFPADGYHHSKLNLEPGEPLIEGIERIAAELPSWPDASYAEWLSRSIAGFFNGEEPSLPDARINEALLPFFESLLTLALRTYWRTEGQPIVESESEFARPVTTVARERLSFSVTLSGQRLSGVMDFGDTCPMLLTLTSPPAIQDFFDLILAANSADARLPEYSAGPRRIGLPFPAYNKFILWDGDKNFHFDKPAMAQIVDLVQAVRKNPEFASHEKAARLAWGAI
jgi:hypothetical protein